MSEEPRWISKEALIVLHDRSIAIHGGAAGLISEGLLESALARPMNRFLYEGETDICALAAIYLVAVAANHAFADGNKRAAFLAAGLFLRLNGWRLTAAQAEAARTVLNVAAGEREIEPLAKWICERAQPLPSPPAPAAA